MKDRAWAKAFYVSQPWIKCRTAYAKSRGNLCERCAERGLIVPGDEVHHKIRLTPANVKDPSVALNWDNLELLCKDCHIKEHRPVQWRADENGHVDIGMADHQRRYMNEVYIISGPPAGGKTYYVRQHATSRDLVFDLDAVCSALQCGVGMHDEHRPVLTLALTIRETVYKDIETRRGEYERAFILTASPNAGYVNSLAKRFGAQLVTMTATREECHARIDADETRKGREFIYHNLVDEWFDAQTEPSSTPL